VISINTINTAIDKNAKTANNGLAIKATPLTASNITSKPSSFRNALTVLNTPRKPFGSLRLNSFKLARTPFSSAASSETNVGASRNWFNTNHTRTHISDGSKTAPHLRRFHHTVESNENTFHASAKLAASPTTTKHLNFDCRPLAISPILSTTRVSCSLAFIEVDQAKQIPTKALL